MEETLSPLLPEGGIRRGTAVAVSGHGAMTLAIALAAEASRRGSWVAAVGMADLGVSALAERGVDLERWALIGLPIATRDGRLTADVLGAWWAASISCCWDLRSGWGMRWRGGCWLGCESTAPR